jgi:hypothetical protein
MAHRRTTPSCAKTRPAGTIAEWHNRQARLLASQFAQESVGAGFRFSRSAHRGQGPHEPSTTRSNDGAVQSTAPYVPIGTASIRTRMEFLIGTARLNDVYTKAFKQLPNREAPLAIAVA